MGGFASKDPVSATLTSEQLAIIASQVDVSGKQNTLVSGSNIKTVNSTSLLGVGNIDAGDVVAPATNTADYIPQWNGVNSKTLKDGVAVPAGGLAGLTALGGKADTNQNMYIGTTQIAINRASAGHFELRVSSTSTIEHDADVAVGAFDISTFGWIDLRCRLSNI